MTGNVAFAAWRDFEDGLPEPPPEDDPGEGNGSQQGEPGDALNALHFRTLAEVASDVDSRPQRKYLFSQVMVAGDYGVLSAEDKAGKTFSGLDAAVSCAAGLPWLGHFACQAGGSVLVFLGEGSDAKMLRRIRAIAEHKGLTREEGDKLPIRLCFRVPFLSDRMHLLQIATHLDAYPARLVVLDPLYLAARGGKGSDLFAMGELLGNVQRIVQPRGATLLVMHHWNKTGEGSGHNRSSGVGPGAWGRFLISVGVKNTSTDPLTKMTTVRTEWSVKGDEIADSTTMFVRKVWTDDPEDLNSDMHYSVAADEMPEQGTDSPESKLSPAGRKLLWAVEQFEEPTTSKELVDKVAEKFGHGLKRETVSRLLNDMAADGLIDRIHQGSGKAVLWCSIRDCGV